jgi:flagellar motor protein MotB
MSDDNQDYEQDENQDYEQDENQDYQEEEQQEEQQEEEQQEEQQDYQEEEQQEEQQEDDNKEEEQQQQQQEQEEEQQQQQTYTGDVPTNLDIDSAWDIICKDTPSINWYGAIVNKKQQLEYDTAGNGGLSEMISYLQGKPSNIVLALLRVNSNDKGGSKRAKFVFVKFIGSKVPFMQKAKLTPNLGRLCERFPVKHLTFDVTDDMSNFNVKILVKEFLRVGGAHKPDSYDFGPGQIQKV